MARVEDSANSSTLETTKKRARYRYLYFQRLIFNIREEPCGYANLWIPHGDYC